MGFKLNSYTKQANQLRSAGDHARDEGDWNKAAEHYTQYLKTSPDDFAIWVQLGHALKEQKNYEAAEAAYTRAKSIEPGDADINLQLGHLLKITGRNSEALDAYLESYKLQPTLAAESEIKRLQGMEDEFWVEGKEYESEKVVYVELDDMLIYLEAHSTVSGIQRVQAEFARFIIDNDCSMCGEKFIFVTNPPHQDCVWALQPEHVLNVINYASSGKVNHDNLRRLVQNLRSTAFKVKPSARQCYLVLGAFWVFNTVSGRFLKLKRAGLRIGGYIHDIVPINQPEYCDERLCYDFMLSFGDSIKFFDFILTNSHYTAKEVKDYLNKFKLPTMPVEAVQLAHSNKISNKDEDSWTPKIKFLRGKQFAMIVSTIEARKNHKYLIDAWRHFYNEDLEPPDLVFVGRLGWRVADLLNDIKQSKNFSGRLHILHGLTDAELNKLYDECRFTLCSSYTEGWGLPVGESLAHGKPCVASSTGAIPEAGGVFADYIDPWNLRDGIEVLRKMCFNEKYLEKRKTNIEMYFTIRTWFDFSKDLSNAIFRFHFMKLPVKMYQVNFAPGVVFRPSKFAFGQDLPVDYIAHPVRLLLSSNFGAVEHWGAWLLGDKAEIEFCTPYEKGTEIVLYLEFLGAPFVGEDGYLAAIIGQPNDAETVTLKQEWIKIPQEKSFIVRTEGNVGENSNINVNIFIRGEIKAENNNSNARRFSVGIKAIGYTDKLNAIQRSDITEDLINKIYRT